MVQQLQSKTPLQDFISGSSPKFPRDVSCKLDVNSGFEAFPATLDPIGRRTSGAAGLLQGKTITSGYDDQTTHSASHNKSLALLYDSALTQVASSTRCAAQREEHSGLVESCQATLGDKRFEPDDVRKEPFLGQHKDGLRGCSSSFCDEYETGDLEQLRLNLRKSRRVEGVLRHQLLLKNNALEQLKEEYDRLSETHEAFKQKERCIKAQEDSHAAVSVALHSAQFEALKRSNQSLERRLSKMEECLLSKDKQIHCLELQLQERELEVNKVVQKSNATLSDINAARLRLLERERERVSQDQQLKADWKSMEDHHSLQVQQVQEAYELLLADAKETLQQKDESLRESMQTLLLNEQKITNFQRRLEDLTEENTRLKERLIELETFLATSDQTRELESARDREATYKNKLEAMTRKCEALQVNATLVKQMRIENIKLQDMLSELRFREQASSDLQKQ